ncbi:MAG: aminotransferase class V-fold PLP-dependent enzyme [Bacteroidota bacterium]
MQRRTLIKKSIAGLAGLSLLDVADKKELMAQTNALTDEMQKAEKDGSFWRLVKTQFPLKDGLHYFNNASLGPSPNYVVSAVDKFRDILESYPSKYMWGGWSDEKEKVRSKAAHLMGVSNEEIALIHNTTEGMNLVASSLDLKPGDEVILSNHEHPSGTIPWKYWQETKGIKLIRPELPILPNNKEEIVNLYKKAISKKTKAISMVHITNTNGMIMPIKEISTMARENGILTAVDGAQSAGAINFSLKELGCDFYAASSHKWLFSPKGIGIFYARKDAQQHLKPLIVAHGYETTSIRRLENYNTRNLPELLGLGASLDYHQLIGAKRKEARLYELKQYFLDLIKQEKSLVLKTPENNDLSAGIITVEAKNGKPVRETAKLLDEKDVNLRPMDGFGLNGLRVSLSVFNLKEDIDYLVKSILEV